VELHFDRVWVYRGPEKAVIEIRNFQIALIAVLFVSRI